MGITRQVHTTIERFAEEKVKAAVALFLFAAAIVLTFACLNSGIEIVFTHFFYIPIIVAAYWYRYRGIALTGGLCAIYLLSVNLFIGYGGESLITALGRVLVFVCISVIVAVLSEIIHRQQQN
jgi:uncharacterized membrane protein